MDLLERRNARPARSCGAEGFGETHAAEWMAAAGVRKPPSFLVAGPPRTGTSWLHQVLSPHARLPSLTKETRFFDQHFERGWKWYLDHFPESCTGQPAGEIAPTYFASPLARERVARTLPQAKLVFIFRHPVERLISLYRLKRAYGLETHGLDEALERDPELIQSGRYATHLRAWQDCFPERQILVNLYEDLKHDPQGFTDRLADFLRIPRFGLDPSSTAELRPHATAAFTEPKLLMATRAATAVADWCKARRLDTMVAQVRESRLMGFLLGSGRPFPEVSPQTLNRISRLLLPEVEKLEEMLGFDLSAWKRLPHAATEIPDPP